MMTLQPATVILFVTSNLCRVCSFIMYVTFHSSGRVGAISTSVILVRALMSCSVSFIKLFFNINFIATLCGLTSSWFFSSVCCPVRIRIDFHAKFSTSRNCCDWLFRLVIRLIFITQCFFFICPWCIIHLDDYCRDCNLFLKIVIIDGYKTPL